MNNIYFTSDLHFGHKNILRYDSRPFSSIEEMDCEIVRKWNNKVDDTDTVYILGDISWYNSNKTISILNSLNGNKILIKGNHDKIDNNLSKCFNGIYYYKEIYLNGFNIVLCHYPIHFFNHHYHKGIMLYGHVHNSMEYQSVLSIQENLINNFVQCEMHNVGCMLWNYEPITLNEILSKM